MSRKESWNCHNKLPRAAKPPQDPLSIIYGLRTDLPFGVQVEFQSGEFHFL